MNHFEKKNNPKQVLHVIDPVVLQFPATNDFGNEFDKREAAESMQQPQRKIDSGAPGTVESAK